MRDITEDSLWLFNILYNCRYKLTSKDKLVAAYLTLTPLEENAHKVSGNFVQAISASSGLAVRTVQKSLGRLVAIGAVSFLTDYHFILEDVK